MTAALHAAKQLDDNLIYWSHKSHVREISNLILLKVVFCIFYQCSMDANAIAEQEKYNLFLKELSPAYPTLREFSAVRSTKGFSGLQREKLCMHSSYKFCQVNLTQLPTLLKKINGTQISESDNITYL